MTGSLVLCVDASMKPISLVPVERAISKLVAAMVDGSKDCQVLIADEARRFRSKYLDLAVPEVIYWPGYIELDAKDVRRVSRRVLFARDGWRCAYCDYVAAPGHSHRLTVDHVKPAHLFENRAAATSWENCVTACFPCNNRKAGRLPFEAGMMPRQVPKRPHYVQVRFAGKPMTQAQRDYVRDYFKLDRSDIIL